MGNCDWVSGGQGLSHLEQFSSFQRDTAYDKFQSKYIFEKISSQWTSMAALSRQYSRCPLYSVYGESSRDSRTLLAVSEKKNLD